MDAGDDVRGEAVDGDGPDDPLEDARATAQALVAGGFERFADVVEVVADELDDAYDELGQEPETTVTEIALRLVADEWSRQLRAQADWPEVTDCDRLDAAFSELEERRIIARQNFWCCQSCGLSNIWTEADDWGQSPRGYVFFHQQATESATEGDDLWLSYGSTDQQDDTVAAVANEAVEVLRSHGLDASWNGDRAKKIHVPVTWQRRLPPTPATLLS